MTPFNPTIVSNLSATTHPASTPAKSRLSRMEKNRKLRENIWLAIVWDERCFRTNHLSNDAYFGHHASHAA